ncbi:FAD-dependent monooxygenase [Pseudarthrobacter sp. NPDC055928]|uniref:FAD-dependent monooxygenase n=1 Tax=Pseudarthrobacter sp. NPDC055928 TaxID=3345661 RepID=UPI0035D8B82E
MSRQGNRTMAIIGGGPAGALLARLLKMQGAEWDITVYERDPAGATYGFGIGLGPKALQPLEGIDPELVEELRSSGLSHTSRQRIHLGGQEITWHWGDWTTLSIARKTLVSCLQRRAQEVGVAFEFERAASYDEVADADLVVATDGSNSAVRQRWAAELGPDVEYGHGYFYWCAARVDLPGPVFAFKENEHGGFATHSYPYNGGMSGFMFEADAATLKKAGLDGIADGLKPAESDHVTRQYLELLFADHLQGAEIVTSASRWSRFRMVRNASWHAGNVVLVGDAAHTAHPSIGSGTRMAMEDALALSRALVSHDDLPAALAAYEAERRPAVERLQDAAFASQRWWETFARRLDLPLPLLALHYATRTGRYGIHRILSHDADIVSEARGTLPREYRGATGVLSQSLRVGDRELSGRVLMSGNVERVRRVDITDTDPESAASDALIESLRAADLPAGTIVQLRPTCAPRFHEALPGAMLADRLRQALGVPVALAAQLSDPVQLDAVETVLLTRRIDLVEDLG